MRHRGSQDVARCCLRHLSLLILSGTLLVSAEGQHLRRLQSNNKESVNEDVIIGTVSYICILFFMLGLVVLLGWYIIRRGREEEGEHEVNEWKYMVPGGNVMGPLCAASMRQLLLSGRIDRTTKVKITWWTSQDFQTVEDLFPEVGTEFLVPAKIDWQAAANDNWHTNSRHSHRGDKLASLTWSYAAPDGQVYGSFENGKMRHWFSEGYLPPITPIRLDCTGDGQWCKLAEVFPDQKKAFAEVPHLLLGSGPSMMEAQASVRNSGSGEAMGATMSRSNSMGPQVYGIPSTASGRANREDPKQRLLAVSASELEAVPEETPVAESASVKRKAPRHKKRQSNSSSPTAETMVGTTTEKAVREEFDAEVASDSNQV